jgi:hypothetical protein
VTAANTSRELAFARDTIEAKLVTEVADLAVSGVVTNLSNTPMVVAGNVPTIIPAWKSTILRQGVITSAERVSVIDIPDPTNLGGVILGDWDWLGNRLAEFPRSSPLYISPYDVVGEVELDPFEFSNAAAGQNARDRYDIQLNLWWAPAKTDCVIHNRHDFLEIHTQIYGLGRIQIYHEDDASTLYREITTAPGDTHDPIVRVSGRRDWSYPWHRGWTDTDAVWMAVELHPKGN